MLKVQTLDEAPRLGWQTPARRGRLLEAGPGRREQSDGTDLICRSP